MARPEVLGGQREALDRFRKSRNASRPSAERVQKSILVLEPTLAGRPKFPKFAQSSRLTTNEVPAGTLNLILMQSFVKTVGLIVAVLCVGGSAWPGGPRSASSAGPRVVNIHHFNGLDGTTPVGPMLYDRAGNLYGVTYYGGSAGFGVVFKLSPPTISGGKWTETVLHSFAGGTDGAAPSRGLTFDHAGNIYGSTFGGGNCQYSCGTIFELSPPALGGGAWTEKVLLRFRGPNFGDGGAPNGGLIFDRSGNLYGTAGVGGLTSCSINPGPCGVAFELSPPSSPGNPWTEKVLYTFTGVPDGAFPAGGLVVDLNGNLYGTTEEGGSGKCTDGEGNTIGCGTAYQLKLAGGLWKESIIYDFHPAESDPRSDMIFDGAGALYGTTDYDVYRLQPPATGGLWNERLLYRFPEGISGSITESDLIFDGTGNLYGTTTASGLTGFGTVYELSPPRSDLVTWTLTTFQTYTGGFDALMPSGGLVFGKNGVLYGATAKMDQTDPGYAIKIIP